MEEQINVVVIGAGGKMGQNVCRAVLDDKDVDLVGAVDTVHREIEALSECGLKIETDLGGLLGQVRPDVVVDFTTADAIMKNTALAVASGAHCVIGATGLSTAEIKELEKLASESGKNVILVPNFAIGAVLMMKMSQKVARYFDRAEIVEYHHDEKRDAPSGTAVLTAEMVGEHLGADAIDEEEKYSGARGARVHDVPVHSVRLPGYVAHQEVIFGLKGQRLTIRHDSIDRTSFMPGVLLAVKEIGKQDGFTYGLDKLMDI